jgi:hypothetical protein
VGGAAHIDFWDGNYRNRFRPEGRTAAGIVDVLGLDYTFNCAPINLRLDWQASFVLHAAAVGDYGAFHCQPA